MAHVIDGNALAKELHASIEDELRELRASGVHPGLATVLVGDDYAAKAYERHLRSVAEGLEYRYVCEHLSDYVELADVLATVGKLNADPRVTGILLLRPFPSHLPEAQVNAALDPMKDVEAAHPLNAGLLALGQPRFIPSTPASCFHALDAYARSRGFDPSKFLEGRTLVVVGRSSSVGKPAQWLGLQRHATVVACHSRTRDLGAITRLADVLIVSVGVPALVTGDMVSEGVIALDVGINAVKDHSTGKILMVGDVDFDGVEAKAEAITPVPGGIGPITDVWLVGNVLAAAAMAARVEPRFGHFG
ncbi:MAG: bifunctional 5,10-methylene-tetrahydrofolate dehydrogenase/5,10-methylene-tetrahydrofolate cyclohydrolase [Actinobacteria bacterium]|nr:bifunctional 5,10-methylene-tetrahydrofolate dehydrogenase/5,10-methylene-tetrahydrofolate cyclohydrolase [Actinomycetota bacterium]